MRDKINHLFEKIPRNQVITSSKLHSLSIDNNLIKKYIKSGWLKRIGTSAFIRIGDQLNWYSSIEALQSQLNIPIHVGGETALKLHRIIDQVARFSLRSDLHIYSLQKLKLPKWFLNADLDMKLIYHQDKFFDSIPEKSISEFIIADQKILISSRERAVLEFLNDVPKKVNFDSIKPIFIQLGTLRSKVIQDHLEKCNSIKLKRLFLYFSRESNHTWYKKLTISKISLGSGKREILKDGRLDSEYLITVSKKDEVNS